MSRGIHGHRHTSDPTLIISLDPSSPSQLFTAHPPLCPQPLLQATLSGEASAQQSQGRKRGLIPADPLPGAPVESSRPKSVLRSSTFPVHVHADPEMSRFWCLSHPVCGTWSPQS